MKDPDNPGPHNYDSSGWKHLLLRFADIAKQESRLKKNFQQAKVGIDLGSGLGDSAFALRGLCQNLQEIHCVDNQVELDDDLKDSMKIPVIEHKKSIQEFVSESASMNFQADVVMIASLQGQPFYKTHDLENLAASIKAGGALLIYYPDHSFEYNETPISEYFSPLFNTQGVEVWIKN